MSLASKISDTINAGTGTFISAPALLTATGVHPTTDKALEALIQGVVGLLLMFLTKWAAKYFDKKPPVIVTPPPVEKQPDSLIINPQNNTTDGKETSK